jgi:hypothetical protein
MSRGFARVVRADPRSTACRALVRRQATNQTKE